MSPPRSRPATTRRRTAASRSQRAEIVECDLTESRRQWLERFLLLRLSRCGECRERAAMERAVGTDHVVTLGSAVLLPMTARELDRTLVGFGAGVAEERPPCATEQSVQLLGEQWLLVVVIEIRRVQQRPRLIRDRLGDRRMRVTE